jgi:hypothetical protein
MYELPRLKQMYVDGTVSLEVFEAIVDYYLDEKGGTGPTVIGQAFPPSVAPDHPPADRPEELSFIEERL